VAPLGSDHFWQIIAHARGGNAPELPSADPHALIERLSPLDDTTLIAFDQAYTLNLQAINTWKLWGAGYVIAGGMSDDGFAYFRDWIIGKGETVFLIAQEDPDALAPYIDDPEVENEGLGYAAASILEKRGVMLPEFEPDMRTMGIPFDEETVEEAYPRLAALANAD
jgi:hypothetical protein